MNLRDTYNKIAGDWVKDHHTDSWWTEGTDKFSSFINPDGLVLDVGCGAGVKTKYLSAKGLHVIGVDFSEKMVEIARQHNPGIKIEVMDMGDIGQLQMKFDGIFAQAVLLHVPKKDVPKILSVWRENLIDGGYLYIAVKGRKPGGPEEEIYAENDYGYEYQRFFSYFTLTELAGYLSEIGMKIEYQNSSQHGNTEWIQIIAKK